MFDLVSGNYILEHLQQGHHNQFTHCNSQIRCIFIHHIQQSFEVLGLHNRKESHLYQTTYLWYGRNHGLNTVLCAGTFRMQTDEYSIN